MGRSRFAAASGVLGIVLLGVLVQCVGDDPSTAPPAGADAGSDSPTGTTDANAPGDSSAPDSGADGGADAGCPDCPNAVDGAHLQLWLMGDNGLDCDATKHVTAWHDRSGHARDAVPTMDLWPDGGTLAPAVGPVCGSDTINGHPVVSFTGSPGVDAGMNVGSPVGSYANETLDVDLVFLESPGYTVFVVEHRAFDVKEGLVATALNVPPPSLPLNSVPVFAIGYAQPTAPPASLESMFLSQTVGAAVTAAADAFAQTAPARVTEGWFDSTVGHKLFLNGALGGAGTGAADKTPPASLKQGRIGNGMNIYADTRVHGQIAEIIGFNAALSDADRGRIESYLKKHWGLTF